MTVMHSIYREPAIVRIEEGTCKKCGQCVRICAAEVLALENGHVRVHDESPFGCIACHTSIRSVEGIADKSLGQSIGSIGCRIGFKSLHWTADELRSVP